MSNPTSNWDKIPVAGRWLNIDGTPMSGTITFTITQRIIAADGTAIYPRGAKTIATLDSTGSILVNMPAVDDPDINPATGWNIQVSEALTGGRGQTYTIAPSLGDLPDGFNLASVDVPADAPTGS